MKTDSTSSADTSNTRNPQLIITEIKKFTENFKPKKLIEEKTRRKIFGLIKSLQRIDLTKDDLFKAKSTDADILAVRDFIEIVQENCEKLDLENIDEDVQEELSELVVLAQIIERLMYKKSNKPRKIKELKALINSLDIALDSLLQTEPNVKLAKTIRISIKQVVHRYEHPSLGFFINRFDDARRSDSIPIKVLYGLIFSMGISLGILVVTKIFFWGLQEFYTYSISQEINSLKTKKSQLELENLSQTTKSDSRTSLPSNGIASAVGQVPKNPAKQTQNLKKKEKFQSEISESFKKRQKEIEIIDAKLTPLEDKRSNYIEDLQSREQIFLVIFAGLLGSIVSILIRIKEFQDQKYRDPMMPFMIGAFKPVIGASFAIFFFTIIRSELIGIPNITLTPANPQLVYHNKLVLSMNKEKLDKYTRELNEELDKYTRKLNKKEAYLIFAIAFAVGFTERIARDTLHKMEETLVGNSTAEQPSPQHSSQPLESHKKDGSTNNT